MTPEERSGLLRRLRPSYARRADAVDMGYLTTFQATDAPSDTDDEMYFNLGRIAATNCRFDSLSTIDRSNYRSLTRDYPDIWTPTLHTHVTVLGIFAVDIPDGLLLTLVHLVDEYPIYDEDDLSSLEDEEITESWDIYLRDEMCYRMTPLARRAWELVGDDRVEGIFWEALRRHDHYPEHDGHDVLWDAEIVGEILSGALCQEWAGTAWRVRARYLMGTWSRGAVWAGRHRWRRAVWRIRRTYRRGVARLRGAR